MGRAVLEELLRLGAGPVRAAVRRPPGRALPSGTHLWPDPVDVADARALAAFCAECRVVVNATGPVRAVGHRVASAALACGADLVDVNDTDELPEPAPYARLLRWRTAVIGA
ncbi:saccharopine dehydrogenase NADP-binding domain-containing protein, partial [Streptomyces swartbergensis]|uniref:saccharopine dehydrogenase NADP-binding domain-containing protein n=1 Tax=Streptomyces swartbergensis TaxID=487165 RepID=UPI003CC62D36